MSYTDASGNRVYKQQDGSFRTGPNGQGDEIADTNVIASLQNAAGSTTDPFKLANVAEGKVAAGSKEAVNGSQLYNAAAKTAEVLGGSVDNDGNLVAPAYALVDGTPAEGKPAKTYNNVGTALNALNTAVTSPLTFGGDNDTANFERKLGSRVFVKGGADAAELSEGNIGVVSNGSDTLNVKLAKELKELASAEFKDADGKKVYEASCKSCHGNAIPGIPHVGTKADWAPRIKQGKETLHKHALEGFNAMPAKGGNSGLSDDEVKAAVDYMANESGAKF